MEEAQKKPLFPAVLGGASKPPFPIIYDGVPKKETNMKKLISKAAAVLALPLAFISSGVMTSCADMLDTESELVQFADDNKINAPEDSIFSVMGIIRQMQIVADRTVLLGELRGDLVVTNDNATKDIKNLAAFNFSEDNKYNKISDFYAIINGCNFFIANADMNLKRLGKVVFEREMTAVKTYRAWTYLQLAKIYGTVPLVLDPVLTEEAAKREMEKTPVGMQEICQFFIDDIKDLVDAELPMYGSMDAYNSSQFFIPVRVLLGELCLWASRYQESAKYFADYLTFKNHSVTTGIASAYWYDNIDNFATATPGGSYEDIFNNSRASEVITMIPMETTEYYGEVSQLPYIFNSYDNINYGFTQVKPSKAMWDYSAAEDYCYVYTTKTGKDTIYVQKTGLQKDYYAGDLRFCQTYTYRPVNRDEFSKYNNEYQHIYKHNGMFVSLYRIQQVYLMFAEALNRAGYPGTAMIILKCGLTNLNMERYLGKYSAEYQELKADTIAEGETIMKVLDNSLKLNFNDDEFTEFNTQGIHSRGCGDAKADTLYCLPLPSTKMSHADSVKYQVPLVEDMIMREMTLEKAFEGQRYYDLMRIALRRNDPAYLAKPIANRTGEENTALLNLLMDKQNWYLPRK